MTYTPYPYSFTAAPSATGAQLDSDLSYISRKVVSVKDYGAKGDGVTDDTAAIRAALLDISATGTNPFRPLYFPCGTYLVSSALQAYTGCVLIGEHPLHTFIKRTPTHSQDTLIVGQTAPGLHADSFFIRNLQFVRPITFTNGGVSGQPYNASTSTAVDHRLTGAQAHLRIWCGQVSIIDNCIFYDMPYGIVSVGSTITTFRNCNFGGSIWNDRVAALQEGIAQLYLANGDGVNTGGANTLITIDDCYFAGKYGSAPRTVTIGTTTATVAEGVSSQQAVRVEGCEGLVITSSYFGGHNSFSITIAPSNAPISSNIKVANNFFDGARLASVYFGQVTAGETSTLALISNNHFNGELCTGRHIYVDAPNLAPVVYSLVISGNVMFGTYYCAMYLYGAYGARVSNNVVSDYNHYGGNTGDPTGSAGVFVVAPADKVYSSCNQWGGGTNTLGATNNCQWGVYLNAPFTFGCGATGEQSMGLGLAGGALVNVPQTYPV